MSTATPAERLLARLPDTPDVHLHQVDLVRAAVLLVDWSAERYRSASFLDDRILGPGVSGAWVPGVAATAAARRVADPRPLHFIFHSGHVGSTLLSRLLDATGGVLGLREPLVLRTFAEAHDSLGRADALLGDPQVAALLQMLLAAWRRGYPETRAVVLKATSSASRVAPVLLGALPTARAVCLGLAPEPYLATLLAGANAHLDLRGHGPERMRRLLRLSGPSPGLPTAPLYALSTGEVAALSWLVETWSQAEAAQAAAGRVLRMDFDALLADVEGGVARVLAHFGLPAAGAAGIAASPVLTQYAKSPDQAYSPALRAELLAGARRDQAGEIRRGLAWLEQQARADARVAALVVAAAG